MRLTFRQGISRYQTDVYATPTFLQKNGEFVDLNVSPDPTIIVFAHKSATYVIEESKTILRAWGPFTGTATRYLYWDVNLLDGALTRGYTTFAPIFAEIAPSNPGADQHWYDKTNHVMKVWTAGRWLDKVRVFAAVYSSQSIIQPYPLGSQAGEVGDFVGGNLVRDAFNKPLRQSDGSFVTSATQLSVVNASTNTVSLETEVVVGMAKENIPKFSFVQVDQHRKLKLARSDDWRSRIIGVVAEDLYISEVGSVQTAGLIQNEQWNWPVEAAGRPLFCGITGEITLLPPSHGVLQIGGYVFDKQSIFIHVQPVTILDDVRNETLDLPVGPVGIAPVAEFTMSETTGTVPLYVQFKSTSLHAPTKWAWDFNGDGVTDSTQAEPGFTFQTPGTYNVKLTVTNEFGSNSKTRAITVSPKVITGINTNLEIQLSGPLQINTLENFPVQVIVSNGGYLTATNVKRTIIIDDADNSHVTFIAIPANSLVTHVGNTTVLTLPALASLVPGQTVTVAFSITAPKKASVINIRGTVVSPQPDSTLSDNSTTLSIRVK